VLEGYGLSETTGMASFNLPEYEPKPGSIGVPVGGT
jgi:long-chain acyl-CoA synthetase